MTHNSLFFYEHCWPLCCCYPAWQAMQKHPSLERSPPAELAQRLKEPNPPIIIDVRTHDEYSAGHIDTALNLPHDELERRLDEIAGDKSSEVIVYCRSGKRARIAEDILLGKGYKNVKDLAGHWQGWIGQAK